MARVKPLIVAPAKRHALVLVALMLATAVVAVATAEARTIPTRWSERLYRDGKVMMTFNTRAITVDGQRWAVAASFKNNSSRTIRIVVKEPGIALATTPPKPGQEYRFVKATHVSPPFPSALRPGQVWRGTFRGRGIASWARYLMVVYGDFNRFHPTLPRRWQWVTDHALRR